MQALMWIATIAAIVAMGDMIFLLSARSAREAVRTVLAWSVLVPLVFVPALCCAADGDAPAQSSLAEWLTSGPGRVALAAIVYALVALAKLVPAIRDGAGKAGKLAGVALLALAAGATAWAAGAEIWTALGTTAAAAAGAVGLHEVLGGIVGAALPLVAARAPWLATLLRALLAPSAPTVAQLQAEGELRATTVQPPAGGAS